MLYDGAMYDIKADYRETQALLCKSSGGIRKIENPLESVVISAYRKTIPFEVRTETK